MHSKGHAVKDHTNYPGGSGIGSRYNNSNNNSNSKSNSNTRNSNRNKQSHNNSDDGVETSSFQEGGVPSFGGFNTGGTPNKKPTSFGSARHHHQNFSSRYRILAGTPTTYSSGGGFIRSSGANLTNVGRGWGQSSSLSVQLAEARASLLSDQPHANFALSKAFSATSPGGGSVGDGGRRGIFFRKDLKEKRQNNSRRRISSETKSSSSSNGRVSRSASARINFVSKKTQRNSLRRTKNKKSTAIAGGADSADFAANTSANTTFEGRKGKKKRNKNQIPTAPIIPRTKSFLSPLKGAIPRSVGGSNTQDE